MRAVASPRHSHLAARAGDSRAELPSCEAPSAGRGIQGGCVARDGPRGSASVHDVPASLRPWADGVAGAPSRAPGWARNLCFARFRLPNQLRPNGLTRTKRKLDFGPQLADILNRLGLLWMCESAADATRDTPGGFRFFGGRPRPAIREPGTVSGRSRRVSGGNVQGPSGPDFQGVVLWLVAP